ncbi:MAG: caspase family protein [Sphingomonadales bacterium]|nr:caspase family protein [Sphingomonadales bacterium]
MPQQPVRPELAWGTRAVSRGLAGIEVDNVLVIFAAAPGQTAADGDSGNSPFAASLARRLPEPGLPIQLLGGVVRDDVLAATGVPSGPSSVPALQGRPIIWSLPARPQCPRRLSRPSIS